MGAKKKRARGRHARGEGAPSPLACLPRARFFFAPIYFLAPATQAKYKPRGLFSEFYGIFFN